ncbi:MAG: VOC family protein [Pseudomonadota bacterium]
MTEAKISPIPPGMHSLTPHLVCDGAAAAIDFYQRAFGAVEMSRMPGPGGKLIHAMLMIGDSAMMLVDAFPEWGGFDPKALKGSPVTIHLYVPNADAVFAQAVAAGAEAKMPMADMFWGDRFGMVIDPFGHHWSIATHMRDLTPEQMMAEMQASQECGGGPA